MLMVLTFESVDETLKSDHSNEGYLKAVLSCGAVGYAGVMPGLCRTKWLQCLSLCMKS